LFKRNLIANYVGQGYAAFIAVAILPLYIQYLGIEAYGLIGVYTVAFALLGFVDSVMQTVVTREMAQLSDETLPHTRSRRAFLRAIEVIVLAVMAVIVAAFWIASDIAAVHWVKAERLPIEMVSVSGSALSFPSDCLRDFIVPALWVCNGTSVTTHFMYLTHPSAGLAHW
jgi:O-antigen/teichoic acid export membrane protein